MPHLSARHLRFCVALGALFLIARLAAAATAVAPPTTQATTAATAEEHFLRFVGDGTRGGTLETSEAVYKNDAGVTVHLVSAVHIAEASYFHDIQMSFEGRDAVLYEMVKSKDAPPPTKGMHSDSPISQLQRFLKDTLDLSFQLDEIDYSRPNFIHADLDAETFSEMQEQRGESFASIMLNSLMKSLSDPGSVKTFDDEPTDVTDLMTRPDGERQFKLLLARHLGDLEKEASGINMLDGTVILTERNKAVIKKLDETITDGKKDIAVFYGAAHMPDLSSQIEKKGFKLVSVKWRPAWDATIRKGEPSAFELLVQKAGKQLFDAVNQDQQQ
jgi:hypothetical protein